MISQIRKFSIFSLVAVLMLTACTTATPTSQPVETTVITPTTAPSPTSEPPSELTVCLGREPQSLYIYKSSSRAQWSVLEAVYDGPIDQRGYVDTPVILSSLPDTTNGDSVITPVPVKRGQLVLDASGNLASLDTGVSVFPAGCTEASCVINWDGSTPLEMDQQRLTYRLKEGLTWSDGAPLTAADSVYSFQLAADPATPVNPFAVDHTASYTASDNLTLVWEGIPGFYTPDPALFFFIPLPQHAWNQLSAAELLTADEANRRPTGWGPYIIENWTANDSITLIRNPNYFLAAEGLPRYDRLIYRFLGDQPDNNLVALVEGECDIVDETVLLEEQLQSVRNMTINETIQTFISLGPEWEHLDFGIRPAAYDAGLNPFNTPRQDYFGDLRTRQAVAACIDRQALISELLFNQSMVPTGLFPPDHPLYLSDLPQIAFDPQYAATLLDEVGWLDHDGDPATPRQALGVSNVLDGTPFTLNFATTNDKLRSATANRIADMLNDCGIGVTVQSQDPGALYSPGPEGVLFGRNFDLTQFAWQSGRGSPCFLYTTAQIPTADNNWLGVNITGWSNPAYDAACQSALSASPGDSAANRPVQEIFAQELPVLPLYYTIHITAARPDLCELKVDSSARSDLWNLENFASGTDCP